MMPVRGWYRRSAWITTFRPDGKGHIKIIADGAGPIEDIEFDDLICDACGTDMGADNPDGSEPNIYYTGSDSLCRGCGLKAEAEHLENIRQTLKRRGWPDFHVKNMSSEVLRAIAHEQDVDVAVGASPADVAKALHWDTTEALLWSARLLEEVNEHRLSKVLFDVVERRGGNAQEAGQ